MPHYRVTIDRKACDGIFACLTRDDRIDEAADGLVTVDSDDARTVTETNERIVVEFDDERLGDAEQAAAACPPDAISVEVLDS